MEVLAPPAAAPRARAYPLGGIGFDRVMALLAGCLIGGLYLDGWAHLHGGGLDTFFTPWHGLLYSSGAAVLLVLGATLGINHARGAPWRTALPPGYLAALGGVGVYLAGGAADL